MYVKTLLGLAVAVGAGVLAHQDPSFEYPAVKPVLTTSPAGETEVADSALQKTISVRFKDASPSDVFDWLSNQGISFVTTDVPKNIKINLNLRDVALGDAIDALGDAMGGGWVRRGGVFVFQSGMQRSMFKGTDLPAIGGQTFMEFKDMNPEQAKKWKEYGEKMAKQFGPDSPFQKDMEKQFGENSDYAKRMEKQFGADSAFQKQMEKQFGANSDFVKKMQKQFGEGSEFQKNLHKNFDGNFDRSMKFDKGVFDLSLKNQDKMLAELDKLMKSKDLQMKKFEIDMKAHEKSMVDLEKFMDSAKFDKNMVFSGDFVKSQDFGGIAKSLTPAQREKNKKQGFLYYRDLTNEQKRMLGIKSDGTWTVTYSRDGETFTVKSDPKSK